MKKSWKPQHRSLWYANPLIYIILTIISVFVCIILMFIFKSILCFAPVALFAGLWYWCTSQLEVYKDYGYSKLTIDTEQRMLIFDDVCMIPFSSVRDVKFKIEEIRDVNSFEHANEIDYKPHYLGKNANHTFSGFCSSMIIMTSDGRRIKFYIDYRGAAKDILYNIRACGLCVSASDDFEANSSGLVAVIFIVVPSILWIIFKFLFK